MKKLIRNNKGETLVESVVSMLILLVFITSISTVFSTSINIVSSSRENAREMQNAANLVFSDNGVSEETVPVPVLIFTVRETGVDVDVPIRIIKDRDENEMFKAFVPR